MARDTSFYYSFLVLPAAQRRAIVAVWDFCRAVDDAVDEAPEAERPAQMQAWREELARCFDGGVPATPQGRMLQPLIPAFGLPRPAFESLIEGVELTERELLKALEKSGVKKFTPQGEKFDPNLHQAMYEVPNSDVPAGHVAQVIQSGYMIGERILRPALVGVSKPAAKAAAN